jgi:hypothetical protein
MENSTRDNEIRLGRQTKTRTETKFPQEETRTKKNQIGLRGTEREQSGAGKPTTHATGLPTTGEQEVN